MKIKTADAARKLGIHSANLLLHVAELDPSLTFNDVWPEIDEAWVETVASIGGHRYALLAEPRPQLEPHSQPPNVSRSAIHVLDKLSRQGKWGGVSVTFDALQNLTHVPKRDLEDIVAALRKAGFLDHDGTGRGTISLAPAKRKEIEKVVQQGGGPNGPPAV